MSGFPRSPSPGYGPAHYARHDLYRCDHGRKISRSFECWDCCLKKAMKNKKKADEWLEGVEARIEELEKEQLWMGEAPIKEDSVYHKRWTSNAGEIKALGKQLKDQPYRAYKEAWKEYNQYFPDVKVKYCADKLSVRRESDGKVFQM